MADAPKAAQEVGQVAVRVLPNLKTFRGDLRDGVEKAVDSVERDKASTLEISHKFDANDLKSSVFNAIKDLNHTLRTGDAYKVRLKAVIANTKAENVTAVNAARREFQKVADTATAVKFKAALNAAELDLELSKASMERAQGDLEKWRDDNNPLVFDIKPNLEAIAATVARGQLETLSRPRNVPIIPTIDGTGMATVIAALSTLAGTRGSQAVVRQMADALLDMDKAVPGIVAVGSGVIALTAAAIAGAGALISFGTGLAQMAALALVLPGTLGGIVIGVGTFAAALADFNTQIPQTSALLAQMQNSISAEFWADAQGPISNLVDNLLPRLASGTSEAAGAMGVWTSTFAQALQGVLGPALEGMFANLTGAITAFGPAAGALAGILTSFGTLGAQYLPQLATWLAEISVQFDEWLARAIATGQAQAWITTAITNIQLFASGLASIASILASVARAANAAGAGGLQSFASGLKAAADVAASPGFQTGLTQVFSGMDAAITGILQGSAVGLTRFLTELSVAIGSPEFARAGDAIGRALGAIGAALADLLASGGATTFLSALSGALNALSPTIAGLGPALTAIVGTLSTFISSFGPGLGVPLQVLGDALALILPALNPIIEALGGAFLSAFTALSPLIMIVATLIAELAGHLMTMLAPILPVIVEVLGILGTAVGSILEAIMPLVVVLLQLVMAVITPLLPLIVSLATMIGEVLVQAVNLLVPVIDLLVGALTAIVNFLMPILVPAIELVADILLSAFSGAVEGVVAVFDGLVLFLQGWWGILSGWFQIMWGALVAIFTGNTEILRAGWTTFWNGLKDMLSGLLEVIKGVWLIFWNVGIVGTAGKLMKALKKLWDEAWDSIKFVATDLWDNLSSLWSSFLNAIRTKPANALNYIKLLFSQAWTLIKIGAKVGFDLVRETIDNALVKAVTVVEGFSTKVVSVFSNAKAWLVNAGKSIINGLIDGIKSMISSLVSTLGSITDKLPDWKGPAQKDASILRNAGQLVMQGFLNGLEDEYQSIRDSLGAFTDDISMDAQIRAGFGATVAGQLANAQASTPSTGQVFNYYAAEGSSIGAEEDLFRALGRGRAVGF